MNNTKIGIIGIGIYIPKGRASVKDIIKLKELDESKFIGNDQISVAASDELPTDMGCKAAAAALKQSGLKAEDIGMLIYCGDYKDYLKWQASTKIQNDIKAFQANCMDLYQSCNSQILAMSLAKAEILMGNAENVLIIAAEKYSSCTAHHTIGRSIIVGDGASAVIVAKSTENTLDSFVFKSNGRYHDMMYIEAGGAGSPGFSSKSGEDYLYKTRKVLDKSELAQFVQDADQAAKDLFKQTLEKNGLKKEDIDYVIMLNGNDRHNKNFLKSLELENIKNSRSLISETGHLGAADVGYNLFRALELGHVKAGERVLIYSGGAGYSWAMTLVTI